MKWFKDLLKGPENAYWDLARAMAATGALMMVGGAGWNVYLGLPLELGPDGLGGGIAAVLVAAAGLIYAKDTGVANAKATEATTKATNAETAATVAATKKGKPGG